MIPLVLFVPCLVLFLVAYLVDDAVELACRLCRRLTRWTGRTSTPSS